MYLKFRLVFSVFICLLDLLNQIPCLNFIAIATNFTLFRKHPYRRNMNYIRIKYYDKCGREVTKTKDPVRSIRLRDIEQQTLAVTMFLKPKLS